MGRIIYNTFNTPGTAYEDQTTKILKAFDYEESRIDMFKAGEAVSFCDFCSLSTAADNTFIKSTGSTSEIILGIAMEEVVTSNANYATEKREVGNAISILQHAWVRFATVDGSISRGDKLILSASSPGKVKAQGSDTTHPVVGYCTKGNTTPGGLIEAMISVE